MRYNGKENDGGKCRCLECGDEIKYGRQDRKFCCPTCKNKYNNRRGHDGRLVKMKIVNALNRNYEILVGLLRVGMTEVGISELRNLGFQPDIVTSYRKCRGRTELCCFDIKYRISETVISEIIRMPKILGQ